MHKLETANLKLGCLIYEFSHILFDDISYWFQSSVRVVEHKSANYKASVMLGFFGSLRICQYHIDSLQTVEEFTAGEKRKNFIFKPLPLEPLASDVEELTESASTEESDDVAKSSEVKETFKKAV